MSYHLLNLIHISAAKIAEIMQEVRHKDYDLLQKVFTGSFGEDESLDPILQKQLRPILIPEGAYAVSKPLKDLQLRESGIEIIAIRRGHTKQLKPRGSVKLHVDDIIILYGSVSDIEMAEQLLLDGA